MRRLSPSAPIPRGLSRLITLLVACLLLGLAVHRAIPSIWDHIDSDDFLSGRFENYHRAPDYYFHNWYDSLPWPFHLRAATYIAHPIQPKRPEPIAELLAAPRLQSWDLPQLGRADAEARTHEGAALLQLHIFSTPLQRSAERRTLIRAHHPLSLVPRAYRHLVEVKFVLGYLGNGTEGASDEALLEQEEREHGDLVRLSGLKGGDNMNMGKSVDWVTAVGRGEEGAREAWWTVKCDDDTIPILPNLLDYLLAQDPSVPTYFGTALGRWPWNSYYFQGLLYGFSYPVARLPEHHLISRAKLQIKTIASVDLPRKWVEAEQDEDAHMGVLMLSLPPKDSRSRRESRNRDYALLRPNPDPTSGLYKLDAGRLMGATWDWWIPDEKTALAWHPFKADHDYVSGWERAQRRGMWEPPRWLRQYAAVG